MSLEKQPFAEAVRNAAHKTMRTYSPWYLAADVVIMIAIIAGLCLLF